MITNPAARLAVCTTAVLLVGLAAPAAAESFVLQFAPRDGDVWTMTTEDRREQDFAGAAPGSKQTTSIVTDQTYEAQPDGSWHVLHDVVTIDMQMNEQPVDNPMLPIARQQQLRLIVSAGGEATDVEGFRSLMRRYERELDPDIYQNVRKQMKIANLVKGELAKWNRSLEGMIGLELTSGDRIGVETLTVFQGNMVAVSGVIEVGEWVEVEGERGVAFAFRYDNTGQILKAAGEVKTKIRRMPREEATPLNVSVRIDGASDFVLVPSTGQMLTEHLKEVVLVPMPQAGGQNARIETEIRQTWTRSASGR